MFIELILQETKAYLLVYEPELFHRQITKGGRNWINRANSTKSNLNNKDSRTFVIRK